MPKNTIKLNITINLIVKVKKEGGLFCLKSSFICGFWRYATFHLKINSTLGGVPVIS